MHGSSRPLLERDRSGFGRGRRGGRREEGWVVVGEAKVSKGEERGEKVSEGGEIVHKEYGRGGIWERRVRGTKTRGENWEREMGNEMVIGKEREGKGSAKKR